MSDLEPGAAQERMLAQMHWLRDEFSRFMFSYKFGIDEITTKVAILQQEFQHLQRYNPIEHVASRLKTPESVLDKAVRRGLELRLGVIREQITDIAGVRVICSFTSDVYRVQEALVQQSDLVVRKVKDYIEAPKPNGYRSLHTIVEVPVFLTSGPVSVPVEVQFRTVAMDFWASLEHKIHYKYDGAIPAELARSLLDTARTAAELDNEMERLHHELRGEQLPVPFELKGAEIPMSDSLIRRLLAPHDGGPGPTAQRPGHTAPTP